MNVFHFFIILYFSLIYLSINLTKTKKFAIFWCGAIPYLLNSGYFSFHIRLFFRLTNIAPPVSKSWEIFSAILIQQHRAGSATSLLRVICYNCEA